MAFLVEKLDVYQKALNFAETISKVTESFPRDQWYLADQLNRAATSIATNLAEGNVRYHKPDRANFFRLSRGSAFECVPLLELARRKALIDDTHHAELYGRVEVIPKMLSALVPKAD